GEHGGRYPHVPHYLNSVVDGVYCFDHRGHGRSGGIRGHVEKFDHYIKDAALAITRLEKQLKERFQQIEIHLLGHSMGGLIALLTLFSHTLLPVRSVTISAPLLGIRVPTP